MIARIRLFLIIVLLGIVLIVLAPVQLIALKLSPRLARKIPILWHRISTKLVGLKINVSGEPPTDRPLILISNHVSWLDIPVLGTLMELSFVAKHEVNEIPGANFMARLQRTIFVVREDKRQVGNQAKEITKRLLEGEGVVLFGEGTTHDGNRIGNFKSALLGSAQYALAEDDIESVYIQPVSIAYTRLHGMPMGRHARAKAAWYGDMTLGPHAMNVMLQSAWDVEVTFGKPVKFVEGTNRREITSQLQMEIREMFLGSLHNLEKRALQASEQG